MWHLESERYVLRLPVDQDAEFLFHLLSSPQVVEHHPMQPLSNLEEAQDVLRDMEARYQARTAVFWIIYDKALQEPIGRFALQNINWQNNSAQLLVDVLPEFWGEGLLFEVGLMAMNFGYQELELRRIEALIRKQHPFMSKYVEAIGFRLDGVLPALMLFENKWVDYFVYSLLATDRQWSEIRDMEAFSLDSAS